MRLLVRVAPFAVLMLGLGCASEGQRPAATADPLTGGVPVPAGGPTASAAPAPTPVPPSVPPLPVSTGTQSLAAIAGGAAPKPLDPTRDLRIAVPVSNPNPGPAPTTLLQSPQPVSNPVAQRDPTLVRGVAPTATHVGSYEQALAFLAARGVKWQRLETWGDQGAWKFSCSIPNPKNAYISRTYEGQAASYLAAVQAVIDQIEHDAAGGL